MRTLKISVCRTVQVERYEPVTVTVEESIQLKDSEDPAEARSALYKDVTQQVTRYVKNEVKKYGQKKAEQGEDE